MSTAFVPQKVLVRGLFAFMVVLLLATCDGPVGPKGDLGQDGQDGQDGQAGQTGQKGGMGDMGDMGTAGATGPAGLSCWDLNGDGVKDGTEDKNSDEIWDALDCEGPQGPPGPPGGSIPPDGSVTTPKLADNAVTNAKIATGAVGSAELLDGEVQSVDLATNAVTNAKIATGAVGSAEILDGSIKSSDLDFDSVGSDQIAAGAVGSSEILNGAVSIQATTQTLTGVFVSFGSSAVRTVSCNVGDFVTGAGWELRLGSPRNFVMEGSIPLTNRQWVFEVRNSGAVTGSITVDLWLRCIRLVM